MSRNLLLKLNNYNYSDDYLNIVKDYLRNKILPDDFSDYQKSHFIKQYKKFELKNDKIFYTPLDLELIPNSKVEGILKEMYNDPQIGIGTTTKSLYNKITSKYLGIKRKNVEDFIKNQDSYQLTKKSPNIINRPIVARYPNHRWAADLIKMKTYKKYNDDYIEILTVIDYFSKKVFAKALRDATSASVRTALEEICEENNNTVPKILQTDNGSEFQGEVKDWAKDNDIKLVRTLAYTPTSNGLIENFNNILRKMIREGFIRFNSLNWVDHLDDYIINRNNSKHSTTKQTPNDVWRSGNEPIEQVSDKVKEKLDDKITNDKKEILIKVGKKLEDKAKRDVQKYKEEVFRKGDHVRVLNSSLYAKVRKLVKEGKTKLLPVKYNPEIYVIYNVLKPKTEFMKERYQIAKIRKSQIDGGDVPEPVITEIGKGKRDRIRAPRPFFASELQRVDPDNLITTISRKDANLLNRIVVDKEDQEEEDEIKKEKAKQNRKPKEKKTIEVIDRSLLRRNKSKVLDDDFVSGEQLDDEPKRKVKKKKEETQPQPEPEPEPTKAIRTKKIKPPPPPPMMTRSRTQN